MLSVSGSSPQPWADYVKGTLGAARSLRTSGTKHDIVVLLPTKQRRGGAKTGPRVPRWVARLLRKHEARGGLRLVRVGPVGKALPRGARHSRHAPAVQAAYRQKLRALQLVALMLFALMLLALLLLALLLLASNSWGDGTC